LPPRSNGYGWRRCGRKLPPTDSVGGTQYSVYRLPVF
jgi:hypothetical protein